jgi:hypothetical protein
MIPAPSGFATDFFNTVTAGPGQTVTLNPGDTVPVLGANGEGIVATGTGTLSASGVTVTTHGNNGSGAAAHAGGRLSIISTTSNKSTVMTFGAGSFGLLSSGLGSSHPEERNQGGSRRRNTVRGGAGTGSGTPRILNLTATGNVSLQGDVLVGTFSVVNINLARSSALAGAIQNATN